jgi:hypothetical protein
MKRRAIKCLVAAFCIILLIWVASLLLCEVLTFCFGDIFIQAQNPYSDMLNAPEYVKVLKIGAKTAKLYYVEAQMTGGHILNMEKVEGAWMVTQWRTVWSANGGSASGVVFPYVWHCIYGGL